MIRVKRGNVARKRRNKILKFAKGYFGAHSILFRIAYQQVIKALAYSTISHKQRKRIFRKIWISRINAACRLTGVCYNQFINKLKKSNIGINKKMLSQIAIFDFWTFNKLIKLSF